jgi:3-oxoacyl-[acyl-carrier protein] reductase
MSPLLLDKAAIVTGSSRGIGRATAIRFAEHGADVLVNYVEHGEEAERTAAAIRELGRRAVVVKASVADARGAARIVNAAMKEFRRIDILVNNAGITRDTFLTLMPEPVWDEVINQNLKGVYLCSRSAAKVMIAQRSGCIINIASLSGFVGMRGQVHYSAAKMGIVGASRSMAQELSRWNIRVNVIAPGWIQTDLTRDIGADTMGTHPILLGRIGMPEEVADCAVFLASSMASYVNATVLHVNGGIQAET